MRNMTENRFRAITSLFAAIMVAIMLSGCPSGGGGGGVTNDPPATTPIHTQFNSSPTYIYELGRSYPVAATVQETRGDDISINRLRTYRTLTKQGNYDTLQSANYYNAGASLVYGHMLMPNSTAYVENSSSLGTVNQHLLKGSEARTIRTTFMVGRQYESKPAGFNGLFITYDEFKSWVESGNVGVKYWIAMEGYDYKLKDNYNIYMPLEITFNTQLINNNNNTIPGPGTPPGTNPYDPLNPGGTNPYP